MPDSRPAEITKRELREAELQMTGRPPAGATAFIGFVPATPPGSPAHAATPPIPAPQRDAS